MKYNPTYIRDVVMPMRCLYPRYKPGVGYYPCGNCRYCRMRLAREWAFRVQAECDNKYVYKCLLTYDDLHLPMYKGAASLNKQDFISMMKRFRDNVLRKFCAYLRFFCVGEYGGNTHRPHYHVILFSDKDLSRLNGMHYTLDEIAEELHTAWRKGGVSVSNFVSKDDFVTDAGVAQMANYMTQYLSLSDGRTYDKWNKPFRHVSRAMAIGYTWLETHYKTIEQMKETQDYRVFCGRAKDETPIYIPLPRYYVNKLLSETEKEERADGWREYSYEFKHYLKKLDYEEHFKRKQQLKDIREIEEKCELEQYRKRKIHSFNKHAGELFKGLG